MRRLIAILSALLSLITIATSAQERDDYQPFGLSTDEEPTLMIEVDTTLFRIPSTLGSDPYAQATRYYRVAGSTRRRGLYYTTAEQIVEPTKEYMQIFEEPLPKSSIALYAAQSNYRVGLRASHAQTLNKGWSLNASLWSQTGRDISVEGLFRNTFSPDIQIAKRFGKNHFLKINSSLYYSMRGLQYGSTNEAFELIGNRYYNPSWGFYNGEVRNSRVRRTTSPQLSAHYQLPLSKHTTLIVESSGNYSCESTSSLGWYNATTPLPDYYSKMPSNLPEGDIQDYVTNLWRTNDTDYTQINWDELVRLNSLSADGNAYYLLEDRVERRIETQAAALIRSEVGDRLTLTFGLEAKASESRNFKEIRDLLGASHFTDYDQFFGDDYNKTLPLQNNLLNPDNVVVEGDRFGYDYSIYNSELYGVVRTQLRTTTLDIDIEALIGSQNIYREGHFEKERFASSGSLGKSTEIKSAPYTIRATVGYAVAARGYLAFKLVSCRLSPLQQNLFLNETASNYLSPSLSGESINSASLGLHLNYPHITISGEIYALRSRNGSSIYSLYDDLSRTMCRASITEIGYRSIGAEVVASLRLHHDLRFTSTITATHSIYDTSPYVELFDDYDLSTISAPTPSQMSGIKIGNTPQITATTSIAYFGLSRYIFNLSASYAALRYEQPSITRRSERILTQAFLSPESQEAALNQKQLGNIFDIEVSASRYFWFENNQSLSVRVSIRNLLGDNDRVYYARESNRINLQSIDGYFSGSSLRESSYQYGAPRTLLLSVGYNF
ncbi:MAG: hypothetical protein SNI51_06920 [Rikenellaceae bacterium]